MNCIIVYGNPVDGFAFEGPYPDIEVASETAERTVKEHSWWVAVLNPPNGEPDGETHYAILNPDTHQFVNTYTFGTRYEAEQFREQYSQIDDLIIVPVTIPTVIIGGEDVEDEDEDDEA